jgi:uncharacterized protein YjbI with pentapeptide repeats
MDTCRIHRIGEKYESIVCYREAWDQDRESLCILHSRKVDKDKDGDFTTAVKRKLQAEDYDFRGVLFPGPFNMRKLIGQEKFTFTKPAYFFMAAFMGEADFTGVTFQERVDFSGATFQEWTDFSEVTFFKRSEFMEATFKEGLKFDKAMFKDVSVFTKATFSGETSFFETFFLNSVSFAKSIIQAKVNFQLINSHDPEVTLLLWEANFEDVEIASPKLLRFNDVLLSKTSFAGTDLVKVDVDWHQSLWGDRYILWDETKLSKEIILSVKNRIEYKRIEALYRQLKMDYERKGDLKRAGYFHYREMEMFRLASPLKYLPFYWYNLYKFLSGYGERPWRAFICLVGFLFGVSLLAWILGLEYDPNHASYGSPVSYWDTVLFIFEKATLQRPAWLVSITGPGKFLANLSILIIPGQTTLFILALRNRLGRRR